MKHYFPPKPSVPAETQKRIFEHCSVDSHQIASFPFPIVGCGNAELVERILVASSTILKFTIVTGCSVEKIVAEATMQVTGFMFSSNTCRYIIRSAADAGIDAGMRKSIRLFLGDSAALDDNAHHNTYAPLPREARIVLWYQAYTYILEHNFLELP